MKEKKIAIMGLGYVGLPLAVGLSSSYKVLGFDINSLRIRQLQIGEDSTKEVERKKLIQSQKKNLSLTSNKKDLSNCNIFIVTVPTPIDKNNKPDLGPLLKVCRTIGPIIKKGDIIVFESTVYPGVTEEICGKEIEKFSNGLKSGTSFFLGYSPERINPGDKVHTIEKINKVVSAQNPRVEKILIEIYSNLTNGEVFLAKNIKVAEASKVIENSQRDINISFINEVAKICSKLSISIYDVLDASSTKWNFLDFKPGLVGGHCIGVDPYYLASKAKKLNINPKVILSGRNTNDKMSNFVAKKINEIVKKKSKILFLGVTFKEDVPDLRNSKIIDLMNLVMKKNHKVIFHDPFTRKLKGIKFQELNGLKNNFDSLVLSVPHVYYKKMGFKKLHSFLKKDGWFFDIKGIFRNENVSNYWSL